MNEKLNLIKREFDRIYQQQGPSSDDMVKLNNLLNELDEKEEKDIQKIFEPILTNPDSLFGHIFLKPYGYAGDFMIIEKLYQLHINQSPEIKKWDEYTQTLEAGQAVRNRKDFFKKYILENYKKGMKVLILGSGPATDVNELLTENDLDIHFDLLDIDKDAIAYAKEKNKLFLDKITFIKANVLRFIPKKQYDLIWSAGLFDYLKDKYFIALIKRFYEYLTENGKMLIGNYSPKNPTRKIMDVILDWKLIYRTEEELKEIAIKAGIDENLIKIYSEPLGINLFIEIRKK